MEENFNWFDGPLRDATITSYNQFVQNYCTSLVYCRKVHLLDYHPYYAKRRSYLLITRGVTTLMK